MIIVDFQHLSYRNLFTCTYGKYINKKDGKFVTEDFIGLYFYQMLSSLNKITRKFGYYGDIVIALDGFKNWRKDIIERSYKGSRAKARKESDINFDEFFKYQTELENFLKGFTKVIRVDKAEADDIGYVLSKHYNEKTLLITSDKDWLQHMIDNLNVDYYDPIEDKFIANKENIQLPLKLQRVKHILLGDKTDEIPSVMYQTELSKEFLNYLNNLKLDIKTPTELEEFIEKNGDEILQNFEGEVYKTPRFGEKSAEKLIANPSKFIKEKVKDKKKFYKNFRINRKLIDMRKMPKEIEDEILNIFEKTKIEKVNSEFIDKYNLKNCYSYKIGNKVVEECNNKFATAFDDLKHLF